MRWRTMGKPLARGLGSSGSGGASGVRGVSVEVEKIDVVVVGQLRLVASFTNMSQCTCASVSVDVGNLGQGARE